MQLTETNAKYQSTVHAAEHHASYFHLDAEIFVHLLLIQARLSVTASSSSSSTSSSSQFTHYSDAITKMLQLGT